MGDTLAVVLLRGVDCLNCEIAKKAMLPQPDAIRALGLKWLHSNVDPYRELGRRSMLYGVPTGCFFFHGKRLGWLGRLRRVSGWHGLVQFTVAVEAARGTIRVAGSGAAIEKN